MVDEGNFIRAIHQLDKNDIRLANAIDNQAKVLQAMQQSQLLDLQKKALKELSDNFTKTVSHLYDSASKYANLVSIAGYAAFFAIWNGTRQYVDSEIVCLLSALLIGISATIFVFFEIYKMYRTSVQVHRYRDFVQRIVDHYNKGEYQVGLNQLDEIKLDEARHVLSMETVGRTCLYASVSTGLLGAVTLMGALALGVLKRLAALL